MRKAATSLGIAGNDLNWCDTPALQHKIRANSKRTVLFFADSRLRVYEWKVEGGKELLWVAIKKVCAKKRLFVRKNGFE